MSELDLDTLRHAVSVARTHGMKLVQLKSGGESFKATLAEVEEPEELEIEESHPQATTFNVTSNAVGYFRATKNYKEGSTVEAGEVVGEIIALGIANDIASKGQGKVTKVLVHDGEPLEFGQIIMELERQS